MESDLNELVQLSAKGQVTLPAGVRKALGIRAGDPLVVSVEDGRVVLQPAVVTPVEFYTQERLAEFESASRMSPEELARAKRVWGLGE